MSHIASHPQRNTLRLELKQNLILREMSAEAWEALETRLEIGEYRKGDKLAEYGLTGLIAGGAIAVAAKSGLLAKLWKLVLLGVAAVVGFFKKLFGVKGGTRPQGRRPGAGTAA